MTNLEDHIKSMKSKGFTKWKIGWESLPKYNGHYIFNTNTGEKVKVIFDDYPPILEFKDGKKIYPNANDFRHGNGYWIYCIGENYSE